MAKRTLKVGAGEVTKEIEVDVHEKDAEPWGFDAALRVVGTPVPRVDGRAKADGSAKYTYDVNRPNLAYARALRCPHAHAKVVTLDLSAAHAMPGVLAAVPLGRERVTYPGAPVAAVCAVSEAVLDDAIAAIRVKYEVLPHVVDSTEAMSPDAPRVDPSRENRQTEGGRRGGARRGDPDAALASAEAKVTAEYRTSVQTHVALEPHGSVAEFDADGGLTLWTSTQAVGGARGQAAGIAGVPAEKVRVLAEFVGGGFGCKFGLDECDALAIRFAKQTGRPVKCMNDRREEHLTGGNRPDSVQRLTIAGKKDGTITALVGETYGTGGNGSGGAGCANSTLYGIPNLRVEQSSVSTFTAVGRAFRAPGHPQGVFAQESAVDELAHEIGMDPLLVRLKNDKHPVRLQEFRIGAERIGWKTNRRAKPGSDPGPVKRGVGCAGGMWYQAGGGSWRVDVSVSKDGSVSVANGTQDIGTGTKTVLAVLVAEELGVAPGSVVVRIGDSRYPPGPGSGGSQTAPSIGPPAREAGVRAREAIAELVAKEWGVEAKDLAFRDGKVTGPGGKETTFPKACSLLPAEGLSVYGQRRPNYEGFEGQTAGAQFAQVAVDVETGVVRVERVVAVHDAGRIVDPLTARNQVNGGVIQGISYALFEERRLDRATGDMVNPTHDTYAIAGMADCPEIDVVFLPMANGINNVGMMGLGEPATVPTAAAVANAVFNAIGVRVRTLPMTPARVLAALAETKGGGQ
jgi:xanthine dehydrogenase YagR molybdenum-binding subunit